MSVPFTRRLIEYALTLFLALSLNFLLPRLMPGNPLALLAGEAIREMPPSQVESIKHAYALDQPLPQQYLVYLNSVLHGDFGYSYTYGAVGQPVSVIVLQRLGWTLLLTLTSLALATIIGTLLGAWAAWRRGTPNDMRLLLGIFVLRSMPAFWMAMIFVAILSVQVHLFPVTGSRTVPVIDDPLLYVLDVVHHAILPIVVLTLTTIPVTFVIMRYAMISVLNADYLRTARAKGLTERSVLFRHAIRNALLPVVTVFALNLGFAISGATVVETVFAYPGIGRTMFEAVLRRDYPLLQGGFLVLTLGVIVANLLADLLYPRLDPRLRVAR